MTLAEKPELTAIKDFMDDPVPIDKNHPGWANLSEPEKESFNDLSRKGDADGEVMTPAEEATLKDLKDIIQNGRPADENHPGFANLSPRQQDQFRDLKKKPALRAQDQDELGKLIDKILDGIPVDEKHPGAKKNLTRPENDALKDLIKAEQKQPLEPAQDKKLKDLKNKIVHGKPLDSSHPGIVNLSPTQKQELKGLENKDNKGRPLDPQEERLLE